MADTGGIRQSLRRERRRSIEVVAWLNSEGLTVGQMGRGRNWVSFSGTAAQVSNALHTSLHRFQVNGEAHFANTSEPEVPEALAGR